MQCSIMFSISSCLDSCHGAKGLQKGAEALALSLNTHLTLDLGLKLLVFSAVTFGGGKKKTSS